MAWPAGAYEQIKRRLSALEAGLRDLRRKMVAEFAAVGGEFAAVRGEITGLRSETRQQFYWVVGLIMATILIPIALRFLPRKVAVQSTF
ncbi:MAG: hypothetical protein QN201_00505 [Armatimonadota bacterium]|nr:hypothetical protein [Armatimonadota bacterium]